MTAYRFDLYVGVYGGDDDDGSDDGDDGGDDDGFDMTFSGFPACSLTWWRHRLWHGHPPYIQGCHYLSIVIIFVIFIIVSIIGIKEVSCVNITSSSFMFNRSGRSIQTAS